jgi:hypothetical protein
MVAAGVGWRSAGFLPPDLSACAKRAQQRLRPYNATCVDTLAGSLAVCGGVFFAAVDFLDLELFV